jgi:hypothetical protein
MVDANGNTVTGDYDMVPILEKFVAQHPDFSYRGAKAVLALTGYNGLLGYRTHPRAAIYFGEDARNKDIADLTAEDLAFIGCFATTAASLSTEFVGGIPSIQDKAIVLEKMKSL